MVKRSSRDDAALDGDSKHDSERRARGRWQTFAVALVAWSGVGTVIARLAYGSYSTLSVATGVALGVGSWLTMLLWMAAKSYLGGLTAWALASFLWGMVAAVSFAFSAGCQSASCMFDVGVAGGGAIAATFSGLVVVVWATWRSFGLWGAMARGLWRLARRTTAPKKSPDKSERDGRKPIVSHRNARSATKDDRRTGRTRTGRR